jgi:hypothetical protein
VYAFSAFYNVYLKLGDKDVEDVNGGLLTVPLETPIKRLLVSDKYQNRLTTNCKVASKSLQAFGERVCFDRHYDALQNSG